MLHPHSKPISNELINRAAIFHLFTNDNFMTLRKWIICGFGISGCCFLLSDLQFAVLLLKQLASNLRSESMLRFRAVSVELLRDFRKRLPRRQSIELERFQVPPSLSFFREIVR